MKALSVKRTTIALTRIEALGIVAAVVVAVGLFLSATATHEKRRKAKRISCLSRLKHVGLSFKVWAHERDERFPMRVSTNLGGTLESATSYQVFPHFQVISNELNTLRLLVCPADARQPANSWERLSDTNISYFIGLDADETRPDMWLAGDRNLGIDGVPAKPGLHVLWTNRVVDWTRELHDRCGNIAKADGSVRRVDNKGLLELLATSGATNRLAIP